jgi:hypothetical protein
MNSFIDRLDGYIMDKRIIFTPLVGTRVQLVIIHFYLPQDSFEQKIEKPSLLPFDIMYTFIYLFMLILWSNSYGKLILFVPLILYKRGKNYIHMQKSGFE